MCVKIGFTRRTIEKYVVYCSFFNIFSSLLISTCKGEKKVNRQDNERELQLQNEFFEFASKRLLVGTGGNIHRSEVIKSFRKYFAKYRVENDQYPLGDLEIEGLLKTWNRESANNGNSVSPAGFLKGVKVNSLTELK